MTTIPALHNLVENFALLDAWEDRYAYLIELGKMLPAMEEALKTDSTLVKGCTSRVWLMVFRGDGGRFHFVADSDAHIVRGLIAVVLSAYEGKTIQEIASVDIESEFEKLGLDQHLSPNRRNGFFAMVDRIRAISAE